jgi:predicted Zn-dependent protease
MSTRRTLSRISIFTFAVAIALVACSGTPKSGERKKRNILLSEADDVRVGRQAAKSVPAQMGLYEDPELEDYVNRLLLRSGHFETLPGISDPVKCLLA